MKTKTMLRALACIIGSLCLVTSLFRGASSATAQDALPPRDAGLHWHLCREERRRNSHLPAGHEERCPVAHRRRKGVKNPSFQAIHPNKQFLYSVSEAQDFEGQPSGSLSAFAIDAQYGRR